MILIESKIGLGEAKGDFLRKLALSETVDEYHANVYTLKISKIWTKASSKSFRNWIEKTWFLLDKVCF